MKRLYFQGFLIIALVTFLSLILSSCSKEKDGLVNPIPPNGYHPAGWTVPNSPDFHGKFIAASSWNLNQCQTCHGKDYRGGNTQSSCYNCHQDGPTACNLCHGNESHIYPPKSLAGNTLPTQQGVGAHDKHLNTDSTLRFSARVECNECHLPITDFNDTNHIGSNPGIAEVVFGSLAKKSLGGVVPNPIWDRNTQKCSNVYCHGYFINGNLNNQPSFLNPGSAGCGTCHGNPTTGNPNPGGTVHQYNLPCYYCHGSVVDTNNTIINKFRHINGVVDFGL
ncbi:MAG: CxxxxCH/CxxCH domain c-type cytochrome [Ignavibacteria bacterium]